MSFFMVDRQAYGGDYWERISFGPFDTRDEAEEFVRQGTVGLFHGGYVREVLPSRQYPGSTDPTDPA